MIQAVGTICRSRTENALTRQQTHTPTKKFSTEAA